MTRNWKPAMILAAMAVLLFGLMYGSAARGAAAALPTPAVDESPVKGNETVVFAGGCFWGIQAVFERVKGVSKATAGYSGGTVKNPGYEEVSSGATGHAESVEVVFDPSQVTFGQLLQVFFSVAHDPTELNYQGPDEGTQYRSAIFFKTPDQERIAKAYIDQLTKAKAFGVPIVTEITASKGFYRAEDYHQDFAKNNPNYPYIVINDAPKVSNLKKAFPALYVDY
jgi:peptide-methionine (S)-S-oxide reductase